MQKVAISAGVLALVLVFGLSNAVVPSLPNNVVEYVPITIQNAQSVATGSNFQQMITFNTLSYVSHLATNMQNVEFSYANGTIIPSWLESYSANAVYWLNIANGISASSNIMIYMLFAPETNGLFNGNSVGEAPTLSSNYAEYDNGHAIFDMYTNFEGNTLPNGWVNSYGFSGGGLKRTIDNGLTLGGPQYTCYCGRSLFYKDYIVNSSSYVEESILFQQTKNKGQIFAIYSNSNAVLRRYYQPNSIIYANGTGLAVTAPNSPGGVIYTSPTPTLPAIVSVNQNSVYANYTSIGTTVVGNILPTGYPGILVDDDNGGPGSLYFSIQWFRVRTEPPNNIMPGTVLLNPVLVHCNTAVKVHVGETLQCSNANTIDVTLNNMYSATNTHGKIASVEISCNNAFVTNANIIYKSNPSTYTTIGCGNTITVMLTAWDSTAGFVKMSLS